MMSRNFGQFFTPLRPPHRHAFYYLGLGSVVTKFLTSFMNDHYVKIKYLRHTYIGNRLMLSQSMLSDCCQNPLKFPFFVKH